MQKVMQRLIKRHFSGMLYICCTFIVTYLYFKGTCLMTESKIQTESTINQHGGLAMVRNLKAHQNTETHKHGIHNVKEEKNHPLQVESKQDVNIENESQVKKRVEIHIETHSHDIEEVNKTKTAQELDKDKPINTSIIHPKTKTRPPVTHIAFLKVHKAGSTTVQNILFRFGIAHKLTFALPERGHYVYSNKQVLPVKEGEHYDIYACHTAYKAGGFSVSPRVYTNLAIIREPLKRMISAAYYYRDVLNKDYLQNVPRDNLIQSLINHPDLYDKYVYSRTRNSMGSDFGFSKSVTRNDTKMITTYMSYLKKKFQLVLLMERFDESLVLMKRKYHWTLQDIIYVKSNSHTHPKVNLTSAEINRFKEISFLDVEIYDTFHAIFELEVQQLGVQFQQEVTHFKGVINDVSEFCKTTGHGAGMEVDSSEWNESFEVVYNDCVLMKMEELDFVQNMKVRHIKMNGLEEQKIPS